MERKNAQPVSHLHRHPRCLKAVHDACASGVRHGAWEQGVHVLRGAARQPIQLILEAGVVAQGHLGGESRTRRGRDGEANDLGIARRGGGRGGRGNDSDTGVVLEGASMLAPHVHSVFVEFRLCASTPNGFQHTPTQ
jgi:hypothetical protein